MRLAIALPGLDPRIGGGFTFVEEVAQALERCTPPSGMELVLLTDRPGESSLPRIAFRSEGTVGRARRKIARSSQRLSRVVGGQSAIEVAAREAGAAALWFPAGGSNAIDLPFIATVWDIQHRTHPWFPEVSAHGLWRARDDASYELLSRALLVVCGTKAGAEELDRFYSVPKERIVQAPHPTPGWALVDGEEDRSGLPRAPFFLYPAQFWAHKNHAMLIRALALHRRSGAGGSGSGSGSSSVSSGGSGGGSSSGSSGSSAELVLVGGDLGVRASVVELANSLGLADAVHFPGFVSREALRALYREARGLIYPAFSGPENLPPLEAFALGCPVANADFPGAREQLGDAAVYFDPTDAGSIAECMRRLDSDSALRTKLIAAGRVVAHARRGEAFVDTVLAAIHARRAMIDPFAARG